MCIVTTVRIHCIHVLKCSNFWMLESNVEMFEYFNALKLAEYWCVFFCLFFLHVVVMFVLKIMVVGKRKYTHKALREKCQALKDLEKGESSKTVAAKYNVPKNTLSNWVKNKEKVFDALTKGTNVKRQKLKSGNHELMDQAWLVIMNWLVFMNWLVVMNWLITLIGYHEWTRLDWLSLEIRHSWINGPELVGS